MLPIIGVILGNSLVVIRLYFASSGKVDWVGLLVMLTVRKLASVASSKSGKKCLFMAYIVSFSFRIFKEKLPGFGTDFPSYVKAVLLLNGQNCLFWGTFCPVGFVVVWNGVLSEGCCWIWLALLAILVNVLLLSGHFCSLFWKKLSARVLGIDFGFPVR